QAQDRSVRRWTKAPPARRDFSLWGVRGSSPLACRETREPGSGLRITSAVISDARRGAKLANQVQKPNLVRLTKPRSHPCASPRRPSAEPDSRVSNPGRAFRDYFEVPWSSPAFGASYRALFGV